MTDYLTYELEYSGHAFDTEETVRTLREFIVNNQIPAIILYDKYNPDVWAGLLTDDDVEVFENVLDFLGFRILSRLRGTNPNLRTP